MQWSHGYRLARRAKLDSGEGELRPRELLLSGCVTEDESKRMSRDFQVQRNSASDRRGCTFGLDLRGVNRSCVRTLEGVTDERRVLRGVAFD